MNKTAYSNTRHNIVVLAVEATRGPQIVFLAAANSALKNLKDQPDGVTISALLIMPSYTGSGRNITNVLFLIYIRADMG